MDQNLKIQLGNIQDKINIIKGMGLSEEELEKAFSKAELDIIEKAHSHKYLRKEGDRYIYEENKVKEGKKEENKGKWISYSIDELRELMEELLKVGKEEIAAEVAEEYLKRRKQEKLDNKNKEESKKKEEYEITNPMVEYLDKHPAGDLKEHIADYSKQAGIKFSSSEVDSLINQYSNIKKEKSIEDTLSKEQHVATILKSYKEGTLIDNEGNRVETIEKAMEVAFEKGGEGSRGGKIIGHTKSGKPIYDQFGHDAHVKFTKEEHQEVKQTIYKHRESTKTTEEKQKEEDEKNQESKDKESFFDTMKKVERKNTLPHFDTKDKNKK
jgi:hypothetical protein